MKKILLTFALCLLPFAAHTAPQPFIGNLAGDISEFAPAPIVENYVPIEAKIGRATLGGLEMIAEILDASLVRFAIIFMIIMFAFWIAFEGYNLATTGANTRKTIESVVRKAALVAIWIWILGHNPAEMFMFIMGPIIAVGTYMSDLILNSVAVSVGISLPDTCGAIREYMAAAGGELISPERTADILCLPTRMSGFFWTAVNAGWIWMRAGIGASAFTFVGGAVLIVLSLYNIWKFAIMGLGAIVDLFLGIIMLPFTAIAMTFGGGDDFYFGDKGATSYKGIAGNIFNQFLKLFTVETMSTQVARFINSALYFVSLSIIVALCAALLSGVINADLMGATPTLGTDDFMTTLMVFFLVSYIANKSGDLIKKLGGAIENGLPNLEKDITTLWGNVKKTVGGIRKSLK